MHLIKINISENAHQKLLLLSQKSGENESSIIDRAILEFVPENNPEKRLNLLRKARGIWENRENLPDFDDLRKSWDRVII